MKGHNEVTAEGFVKSLSHPRKQQLARMLIDGTTIEALEAAGFGRINVMEMTREIKRNVQGMEAFSFDYPRNVKNDVVPTEEKAPEVPVTDSVVTPPVENPVPEVTTPVVPSTEPEVPVAPTEPVNDQVPTAPVAPVIPEVPVVPEVTNPVQPTGQTV